MTPQELAKVKAMLPVSDTVARLSMDLESVCVLAQPAVSKRIRQSGQPLMNKLEERWYAVLKDTYPEDCQITVQAVRFKLGNGIWYKPDFVVFGHTVYAYEVKGPHAFRGGFENLKVAAGLYTHIKWYLVWQENGEWKEQEVLA